MKSTTTDNRSQQARAPKEPAEFPVQVWTVKPEKWHVRGNPKSSHNPDNPIVVLEDNPFLLTQQVAELVPPKPAGKTSMIYSDWTTNVHPAELLFKIGKDAESGEISLTKPVWYMQAPSMQYNGGICFYHDGTPDDIWKQLTKALLSIARVARADLPDASGFVQYCVACLLLGWEQFLPLESFADLADRVEEEERESEGVSQNDSSTPSAPNTATD